MIQIKDGLYIDSDESSLMLVKWNGKTDKKGHKVVQTRKYYSDFTSLLTGIYKYEMIDAVGNSKSLEELSNKVLDIKSLIEKTANVIIKNYN